MIRKMYLIKSLLAALVFSLFCSSVDAIPYYVVNSNPWGQTFNNQAMDQVYGAGNWAQADFNTPAVTIFAPTTPFVMLEGSDGNSGMPAFITANQALIEAWVYAGGRLFINAAPNYGSNQNWGFDNTTLIYPNFYTSGRALDAGDTIFMVHIFPLILLTQVTIWDMELLPVLACRA